MDPISIALIAGGLGLDVFGKVSAGKAAKKAAAANAATALDVGKMNADLVLEGSELNAEVDEFNARVYQGQATDAITRGREDELKFRQQLRSFLGTQRATYAASNVDIAYGSPVDVQADSAKQGELDALTIRTNAAREAWGYNVQAKGLKLHADNTRKIGKLTAQNTRDVARAQARNYLAGGNYAAAAQNWAAAGTLATGAAQLYVMNKYGGART